MSLISRMQSEEIFASRVPTLSQFVFYTLFHNSAYRFFYSVDGKSYDPRLIIFYQPRRFYEFYCKGFHYTKKVLIAVWPLSGFSKKCVDEKMSVECSQSRTGNSIVLGILQVSVILKNEFSQFFINSLVRLP